MEYPRHAWAEVDLRALRANVRALRSMLSGRTLLMVVVKADGYGHGAVRVAGEVLAAGADRLGVATIEEAVELREAGIGSPIHLLSEPPPSSTDLVVGNGMIATVCTAEFATALSAAAVSSGRQALFHVKLDTGMNRVGVRHDEVVGFLRTLARLPRMQLEGVFTHFATADEPDSTEVGKQMSSFLSALTAMEDAGFDPGVKHAANSAATVIHPETHMDMVRCGIAVYGLHPSPATYPLIELHPAMSVKTRVSFVKTVPPGEGVSYGLTYRATTPVRIATLPLGYADGVHRAASGKFHVLVAGQECRQVGRVCMDQLMVELPEGLSVGLGDEAVLVGSSGGRTISMDELAGAAGTINYEIACALGMRLERVYRPSEGET